MGLGTIAQRLVSRRFVLFLLVIVGIVFFFPSHSSSPSSNAPIIPTSFGEELKAAANLVLPKALTPHHLDTESDNDNDWTRHAGRDDNDDEDDDTLAPFKPAPHKPPPRFKAPPQKPPADFLVEGDEDSPALAFRKHLEDTTSPEHFDHAESRTLTFDNIYVVSLPARRDLRDRMEKVGDALGLEFTFVDAVEKRASVVSWIGERVKEVREMRVDLLTQARRGNAESIGGGGVSSIWLERDSSLEWPSLTADPRWPGQSWVEYLFESERTALRPTSGFNVNKALVDLLETDEHNVVKEATIAQWYSHLKTLAAIAENGDSTALILEDDVDIEWDIQRRWSGIHSKLPESWDLVYLGTCLGDELNNPALLHPNLRKSTEPRCTFAYAVSQAGAKKLVAALNDPWVAFQATLDTALPFLIAHGVVNSYSVEPAIIVKQNGQTGILADSTLARIRKDQGDDPGDRVYDPHYIQRKKADADSEEGDLKLPFGGAEEDKELDFDAGKKSDDDEELDEAVDGEEEDTPLAARPVAAEKLKGFHPVAAVEEDRGPRRMVPPAPPPRKPAPRIGTGGKFVKVAAGAARPAPPKMKPPPNYVRPGGKRVGTGPGMVRKPVAPEVEGPKKAP